MRRLVPGSGPLETSSCFHKRKWISFFDSLLHIDAGKDPATVAAGRRIRLIFQPSLCGIRHLDQIMIKSI